MQGSRPTGMDSFDVTLSLAEGEVPLARTSRTVQEWLISALRAVARRQPDLWTITARERSRVAQVAMELRRTVPAEWDIDVDYRRHGSDPKRATAGLVEVDLLIHHRGQDGEIHNLLIAEFKVTHAETFDWLSGDGAKVLDLQRGIGHAVAALVSFGSTATDVDPHVMFNVQRGHRDQEHQSVWDWSPE